MTKNFYGVVKTHEHLLSEHRPVRQGMFKLSIQQDVDFDPHFCPVIQNSIQPVLFACRVAVFVYWHRSLQVNVRRHPPVCDIDFVFGSHQVVGQVAVVLVSVDVALGIVCAADRTEAHKSIFFTIRTSLDTVYQAFHPVEQF